MKKVSRRSAALFILVGAIVLCLLVFFTQLAVKGERWAMFAANGNIYKDGVLQSGTLLDRSGEVLNEPAKEGGRLYSDSAEIRTATLHAVGDAQGNVGTGALTAYAAKLTGYTLFSGVYLQTGEKVYLSIDAELNRVAYKALGGRKGAVAVANYKTGEILCMVSAPSFDPLNVPDLTKEKYEGAYINRVLSSAYTPGSVFKLVTLAAAIENVPDLFERTFECSGGMTIGADYVKCTGRHGTITIEDALAVSCNSAFAALSLELGADTLSRYAGELGLTESIEIDTLQTAAGQFEKAEAGSADLAWAGIGQYRDTVCPAAMLRFVFAIANEGKAANLTLLRRGGIRTLLPTSDKRILSADTAEKMSVLLSYNVYKSYGESNFPGLELYAKTGTAEVGGGKQPHAWFVGYITNEDCPFAFVVVVENGGSGRAAAGGVANTVLQEAVKRFGKE
jgi:cell division protein FtsI/penicillin-binding protein 2